MRKQTILNGRPRSRFFGWLEGCLLTSLAAWLGRALMGIRGVHEEVEISLDSMQLKVDAKHDGQTLQVRYILTNDTPVNIFVQHLTTLGLPITRPYTYHVRQHQVVLWMGTPPCILRPHHPPPRCFAWSPTPWAQRLLPGESLNVLRRISLPLVELDLWFEGEDPPDTVWANVIRFRLDVQPMRRGLDVSERQGRYWVYGHDPVVLEASTPIDPPIPVHRYGEEFHRAGLED